MATPKTAVYDTALKRLGYEFKLNLVDDAIEVNGERIDRYIRAEIRCRMSDMGFGNNRLIEDAYTVEAKRNEYHPIKDYLNNLVWDGYNHIEYLACHFKDAHGIFPIYLKHWCMGCVAKVLGQCQNPMFVLDGPQDVGKSYFVGWLASGLPDYKKYYTENSIHPDSKDDKIRLTTQWIWEVPEFGSTIRKADRESLKNFITMQHVTIRKPYDRDDVVRPALASFIATINNEGGFLSDPTGNRRFLACTITDIDHSYTRLDPSKIWAEAVCRYKKGERWQLSKEQKQVQSELNEDYMITDPVIEMLYGFYFIDKTDEKSWIPTVDILNTLNGNFKGTTRSLSMDLSTALRKLGLKKGRGINKDNQRVNGYFGLSPKAYQDEFSIFLDELSKVEQ